MILLPYFWVHTDNASGFPEIYHVHFPALSVTI